MTKLCEIYAGACLDDTLFVHLMDLLAWERLRDVLVQTYFASEIEPQVTTMALSFWLHSPVVRGGMN
jgi:hypothetical protein